MSPCCGPLLVLAGSVLWAPVLYMVDDGYIRSADWGSR